MTKTDPSNRPKHRITVRGTLAVLRGLLVAVVLIALGIAVGTGVRAALQPIWPAQTAGQPAAMEMGTATAPGRKVAFWKSSMIPNFVSPKPGLDPMGMDLIPVYADELSSENLLTLSGPQMDNMGLRTVAVRSAEAERIVRTVGQVDYAEPLLGDVTLKVGGWIEKLMVNYVGQQVKKDEPLLSLYSPELVAAEEEYLLDQQPPAAQLPQGTEIGTQIGYSAYDKLRHWDVPEEEIEAIRQSGQAKKAITFHSPFTGWVIEKHAFEGMHMMPGTRYYRIADLSTVWVYVYIYEYQLAWVRTGQPATMAFVASPGQVFDGKVIYIYPHVDPTTRQIRVRLEFPNPDLQLKPEMYGNVEIHTDRGRGLVVPLDAVIYTGQHETLDQATRRSGFSYVQLEPGTFQPRKVVLGDDVEDGNVQVLSGLAEGDQVVVAGQFLLEAERKVKEATLKMFAGSTDKKTPAEAPTPQPSPSHPQPHTHH